MSTEGKKLSNPFSTGGGGGLFEAHVQASFVILMLANGFLPCLAGKRIYKIKLQGRFADYQTDDLIAFTSDINSKTEHKLLAQIKHSVNITESDPTFGEVISAAWNDYNNPAIFTKNLDSFALITGPLSATDIESRITIEWARSCENSQEFFTNVALANFSSDVKREKLKAFRTKIRIANNNIEVPDAEVFDFLKHFNLLGYDLDIKSGVTLSLLHSLIGQYSIDNVHSVWTQVVDEVQNANKNAGTLTLESIPPVLRNLFIKKKEEIIPQDYAKPKISTIGINWLLHRNSNSLIIANIVGSWYEQNKNDQSVIEKLSRNNFDDWILAIQDFIQEPDSPLKIKNGHWRVIDRIAIWNQLVKKIFDTHLDGIRMCSIEILTEIDPQFELPEEERLFASIRQKERKYSFDIRKGISETLALIGTHGNRLANCTLQRPELTATLAIREILQNNDWRVWASLNDVMPILAEASPTEFLSALESKLLQHPCPIDELFPKEGSTIFSGNYMTGLLWALEILAWSEDYLSRVILILAELTTHDPGSNWSNRPSTSITTILLPWMPQTIASIEKRIGAIKAIQKDFPEIAWKSILNMLPNHHQTSSGCQKPQWRKFIPENWDEHVTNKEYWEQVNQYAELAVRMAQDDLDRLTQLVDNLDNIPAPSFDNFIEHLSSSKIISLPEQDRRPIWETLCAFINKHRRFSDTEWALKPDVVDRLENIATKIKPVQPQYSFQRLFIIDEWNLYEENDKYEDQAKKFEEERQNAINAILSDGGIDAVIRFAEIVEDSSKAGWSLGKIAEKEIDDYLLPTYLEKQEIKDKQFISSFIVSKFNKLGTEWLDELNHNLWTTEHQCQFLIYLPFEQDIWNRAKTWLGESEESYWKKVNAGPMGTKSELNYAIDKLLENGRPILAIECLQAQNYNKKDFNHKKAVEALLKPVSSDEPIHSSFTYHVTEIIKIIQNDPDINEDDLAKIEWAYLALLDGRRGNKPKVLERNLSTRPEFFCEVMQFLFRSKKEEKKEDEVDERKQAIAHLAWKLLHNWRRPPGLDDNGLFFANKLIEWYEKVKEICIESGHLEIALIKIGEVFFYAPVDPDGLWIHKAVAELLDHRETENIRRGYSTKVFNSRGAYCVDPSGKPEHELSQIWKKKAEEVEAAGFVRFAATLMEISHSYEREAERVIAEHKAETENEIDEP